MSLVGPASPIVAIDLTVLAEVLPLKWSPLLSALACVWGLGSTISGLIGEVDNPEYRDDYCRMIGN